MASSLKYFAKYSALSLFLGFMTACGQIGPLYLPEHLPEPAPEVERTEEENPTTEDDRVNHKNNDPS